MYAAAAPASVYCRHKMFTRPHDLSDQGVADAVEEGWRLEVEAIEYQPVGFGSFHWRLDTDNDRWFVTVDDLITKKRHRSESHRQPLRRLRSALSTARYLRDEGLTFVVAPVTTTCGSVLHVVGARFALAVYPYVEGESRPWDTYRTRADRLAVLDLILAVHDASGLTCRDALADDLGIPNRDELATALTDVSRSWDAGPYGEQARALLARHADAVERVLARYDTLASQARRRSERFVLTHGEPHPGNILITDSGRKLVDWDTALLAPPERDLWILADGDPQILKVYEEKTGVTPLDDTLALYRLRWDLTEIAIYISIFRGPHRGTSDTSTAWAGLRQHLDPTRWRATNWPAATRD
jgi:aminoglycoside phosphotransferase (APT) family kinase protein